MGDAAPGSGAGRAARQQGNAPAGAVFMDTWAAAESRLYSLIVFDAELYQLAVTLAVEARDALRDRCATVSELIGSDPETVLACCPSAAAVRDLGFDPILAFDAARMLRLRELSGAT